MNGFTLELCLACVVVNNLVTGVVASSASPGADDDVSDDVSPGAAFVTRHDVLRVWRSFVGGGASASCGVNIRGDFSGGGGEESCRFLAWLNLAWSCG